MSKFKEIVDRPWVELTLLAESIPHLLHWDLSYLWILEKARAERPDKWQERVEAWKYLLTQLLMDQLIIEEAQIEPPLIHYTKPFKLETVSWLRIKGVNGAVGILSPVVLVRPLPDYQRNMIDTWRAALPEIGSSKAYDLHHLLQLAVINLKHQPEDSFAYRLGDCMKDEFSPAPTGRAPNTRSVQYPFLERLGWSYRQDVPHVRNVPIFVRAEGDRASLWVPRCERQECSTLLTRSESEVAIVVQSDIVSLTCANCSHENKFSLSDFLIWLREGQHVVVWRRDGVTSSPHRGFPPLPKNSGSEVEFEWNPGPLGGELNNRFLKLSFPGRVILEKSISEICYTKLIVSDTLSQEYKGLPFRSDWLDAVENLPIITPEVDTDVGRVTYRNVKIKGLPVDVDLVFGSLTILIDPSVHFGLYPDPNKMPPGWKLYRAFLAGANRNKYAVKGHGYKPILPWLAQFDNGAPNAASAEAIDGRNGVTYFIPSSTAGGGRQEINVGIDFGTSNTLIYVGPRDSSATNVNPEEFAVRKAELSGNIRWFTRPDDDSLSNPIGDFLPNAKPTGSSIDPYLIPTAIWQGNTGVLLRWTSTPPADGMRENGDFKSNDNSTPPLRLSYLRELMFLTMPQIIKQAGAEGSAVKLNLGFAFPLAFGVELRHQMLDILNTLKVDLEQSNCEADFLSISESRACVRAFGSPRPNEHYLIADMGGGTLDLALFSTGADENHVLHQIGSLRYAGEQYVAAFAKHQQQDVWKIRDSISSGESPEQYGSSPAAAKILDRFVGFAFEYLRTMLLAFKQERNAASVKLVLVGNGWHLAEAFSSSTTQRGRRSVFEQRYKHLVSQLGIEGVELHIRPSPPDLPSSKHLVVIGALRNSWQGQGARELNSGETQLSKLPAGRGMQLGAEAASHKRFSWSDLVGDGVDLPSYSLGELKADSVFFLNELPGLSDSWKKYLLEQFSCTSVEEIQYPSEDDIREQINNSIRGVPPTIALGPLQIILEQSWVSKLNK